MMEIQERVAETIAKYGLLSPGQKVITGISGGADSLCLLVCLHTLGYQVVIAHLDHQLREESAQEAHFVEKIGRDLGLKTIVEKGEVRRLADRGYSLEEAARLVRYQFMARLAKTLGVDTISTGHTADDQIETVLMHFLRGAGPSGLRGILPDTSLEDWVDIPGGEGIHLVRPLLEIRHAQTETYCRQMNLNPVQDPSNTDPSFFRNKIRHHLIPLLKEYNPGIENILLRMARVMEAETILVEDLLQENSPKLILGSNDATTILNRSAFEEMPVALQRSFVRRVIKGLDPGIRNIGFDHIDRAIEFLSESSQSKQLQLLAGLEILTLSPSTAVFRKEGAQLSFPEYPQLLSYEPQGVTFPFKLDLQEGWSLQAEIKELKGLNRVELITSLDQRTAALDIDTIRGEIRIRTIYPGDRIKPLGMDGHMKVSDLFINSKILQPARANWPLVVDDEKIIWVVGLRIADDCRLTSTTREMLFFRVNSPEEKWK
ncbi:MAG: tRNA lysidine(34) synthetase TilS [Chloroflexi bacterium RBG_16_48_8]|nr:MAG: tRNA lysidine(34) synthetase TilS [Chloroflexi bacterium RBG_16_48_8]